jgi:hypothetical protein
VVFPSLPGPKFLWAWIFLASVAPPMTAQVMVRNGLSHIHAWNGQLSGSIELKNLSDHEVTAYLTSDSLWGVQHSIQIPSEVRFKAHESRSVPYQWLYSDSTSQATRIYVTTAHAPAESTDQRRTLKVHISTRYAVDLYRGPMGSELALEWVPEGIRVQNPTALFWAGACFALRNRERSGPRLAGGVLRPGDVRIWPVPSEAEGVWIESAQGTVLAAVRP